MDYDGAASPSPSPSPSRSPSPLPIAYPVTVASAPPGHLALAIPIDKHGPSSGGGSGSGAGREDAWSDGATSSLIDAWGERFVALGRGSLRHPQWQEVAEVVSSRDGYSKPPKSDVQCKNRIDTLKKKYKVEKAKSDSSWPFFDRLDFLLAPVHKLGVGGNSAGAAANSGSSNPSNRSTAPMAPRVNFPQRTRTAFPSSVMKRRLPSPPQASASSESSDGFPPEPPAEAVNGKRQRLGDSANGADSGDRLQGLRDLAQAIRRLGETYERVESSKRAHELRIERDRLAAESELEDQRVQFFLKMQMEISKPNNGTPPLAAASMIGNSASTAADGRAAADGNGSRRASMATDVVGSCSHHVQYGVMDDDRHHHASQPPSSQYNNRSNVAADATGTGSGSDSGNKEDKEDEEEEMEDEEEERQ